MSSTPLSSILAPQDQPVATPSLFWEKIGIERCYCMLITGRCGSTLLTKLISAINAFGQPEEYFTDEMLPHLASRFETSVLSEILPSVAKCSSPGNAFGFQIDPIRLSWIQPYWDLSTAFKNSWISLMVMKRYDLISQAYSYLISKKSGRWHIFSGQGDGINSSKSDSFLASLSTSDMNLIGQELLGELLLILRNERSIERLLDETGLSPLSITYEELLADRYYVMFKIFRSLGANHAAMEKLQQQKALLTDNPTLKNPYDFKEILVDHLQSKCSDIINSINIERHGLIEEIEAMVSP